MMIVLYLFVSLRSILNLSLGLWGRAYNYKVFGKLLGMA